MRNKVVYLVLGVFLSTVVLSGLSFTEETLKPEKITKIERVRWSGLSLGLGTLRWRIFGSWATLEPEFLLLFPSISPYFRLNENDQTVFRGLGRESDFMQFFFPTLRPRKYLIDIISVNDMAFQSLDKFAVQVRTAEKVHMGSTALLSTGKISMVTGVAVMFVGLATFPESDWLLYDIGAGLTYAGFYAEVIGLMGRLTSRVISVSSFAHLHDATDYFNAKQTK